MRTPDPATGRHPAFKDATGQTFGVLRVESEAPSDGATRWNCVCLVCGAKMILRRSDLNHKKGKDRCSLKCGQARAALGPVAEFAPAPPRLDPDRNRERYVRIKLELRSVGLEPLPFAELTCAECPEAPRCKSAFKAFNVNGECLESM